MSLLVLLLRCVQLPMLDVPILGRSLRRWCLAQEEILPSERKSAFGNADDFGACMKKEDASVLRSGPQAASSCVVALISLASWLRSLTNLTTPFSLSFTTGPVAVSGGDTHRPKREMKYHVRAMSPMLFSCRSGR